ncbi:nitroimidazol reductase NimA-like FMN-containing flavoprotein (pyridoxamine 5'-phosphate oxidase superfamily) [Arthrobacter sp. V1I9]|uniref:pyridoxamine 5'-phosphate oxidase family protein n=1 Tax=Arthrobacter sp. V1I9 TaxID=3042275 RepID=UPI002791F70C|nr:pyridoxamine 5'-phosphate oxidase family protein [Arthrobacter sp. V1I9]MDQ0867817.1 nitroimidazol reductase NimA-like FMN-containing flavoprotein (pyridoxamine 5'-phosphate oxidase superfamily) [Arthrobacter sp. V1I9]
MDTAEPGPITDNLSVHDCWKYLRSVSVCRVAVLSGDRPDIFPVNYVPNYGTIIFRTGPGTKLDALLASPVIVLEADGLNRYGTIAWSVVIKGQAEVVSEREELQEAVEAGLSPWQPGVKDNLVRVTPVEVSGRRFVISSPSEWWPPLASISSEHEDVGETR